MADNGFVTVCSPFVIVLTAVEEAVLSARTRSVRSQHRDMVRARIVLAGLPGRGDRRSLGISVDTARKWRKRFAAHGVAGLDDLPRSGRPRRFTAVQVAQVKALACTLPAETGRPSSRWSSTELDAAATSRGSTGPGSPLATPTSPPKPAGSWTRMHAAGAGDHSGSTST